MSAPYEPPPGPYSSQPHAPSQGGTAPARKRWPLFAALGCGCLLLLGLAVIALVVGLASMNRQGDEPSGDPITTSSDPAPRPTDPASAPSSTAPAPSPSSVPSPSPSSDPSASAAPTEADQDAARGRFHDFLQAAAASDFEGACGMTLDPDTDAPPTGAALDACTQSMEGLDAQTRDNLSRIAPGDISFEVLPDGTLDVYILGERFDGVMMKQGETWYLAVPE